MPPISILIKPVSGSCNLQCSYCFYHSIAEQRTYKTYGTMDSNTLERLVAKAFDYAKGQCSFAFQGGEPTLAGLDFFRTFVKLVDKYRRKGIHVGFALQTNGLMLDEEWAGFLAENRFLVGISLDGPAEVHDLNRTDLHGAGSYNRVMNAIRLLDKFKAEYNILCVVSSVTARHIQKIYKFYKDKGFRYLQFIPCLDPLGEEPGQHTYSLAPSQYAAFLKKLFDLWYADIISGYSISIRYFDNLLSMLLGNPPESCGMAGFCTAYLTLEADGSAFPCDFYVLDQWCLGNIRDSGIKELMEGKTAAAFVNSSRHTDIRCLECEWRTLCRGGCRRNREPFRESRPVLNYYCEAYREFFEYSADRWMQLAEKLAGRR